MATPSVLLIAVLACDYQRTADGKQDGRMLGPHSLTRLRAGVNLARAQSKYRPVFVFSAGRLKPEHQRLCDLQAEFVQAAGFSNMAVPLIGVEVWGSEAELQYATKIAQSLLQDAAQLAVVTEDYHMYPRGHRLITEICDPKLSRPARRIAASSAHSRPSLSERLHEWLWFLHRQLPASWRRWLQNRRRRRLIANTQ